MENKNFDLKSDKVRSIIGSIPSRILRQGNAVISLLILCMTFLAHILPYYDYQYLDVSIQCIPQIRLLYAPYDGIYINVEKDSLCEGDIYGFILTTDNRLVKLATPSSGVLHESIIDNTVIESCPTCSTNYFAVRFYSTKTTFNLFIFFLVHDATYLCLMQT